MKLAQRLERLSQNQGISFDQAHQELQDAYERIRRVGIDVMLRELAEETGTPEEEVRASFDEAYQRELERRAAECD